MRGTRPRVPAFWAIADELIAAGTAEEGTMMGHPCLRVNGSFFATAGHDANELIVKLPADRVAALIAEGIGQPFAPAGRRFREWVAVPYSQRALWRGLVAEAQEFVMSRGS
jgi:hypothetical protein